MTTPERDQGTGFLASFEAVMRLALEQAAGAAGSRQAGDREARDGQAEGGQAGGQQASDPAMPQDVPVGAVLLDGDGTVVGAGRNRREIDADPTAHAEIVAIRAAARRLGGWRLDQCTLVVTLEPCTMCAGALLAARIRRLVYGAADPRAGAAGSLWDVLHDRRLGRPPEVVSGVLASDCAALLQEFFRQRRKDAGDTGGPALG